MKKYDVIVIGSGSGSEIVENALNHDAHVALVDIPPIGGTCQNVGCIPSKMLIYPADVIRTIQEAEKIGVDATVNDVDFHAIMERMRSVRKETQDHQMRFINEIPHFDYYPGEGSFIDSHTVKVGKDKMKGDKIFVGSGVRPFIPPIKGIDEIPYLTNESLLELEKLPKSMTIIGGGYISAEYAHFFSAMGTDITIVEQSAHLVSFEEPEISSHLEKSLKRRMEVYTNTTAIEVYENNGFIHLVCTDKGSGKKKTMTSDEILVAAGRTSNADLLHLENTDIEVDDSGFIRVNEYLETTQDNTWAFGDITGKHMFKHVANQEAFVCWNNAFHEDKIKMKYHAVPHAVYSYPQIASVGLTQEQAEREGFEILVGMAKYDEVAKGDAMMEREGFAKAIVDKNEWLILGFHIIGPYAPMIIQEVITIMSVGGQVGHIGQAMHIHPSLPELVQRTLANVKEVNEK